jgi:hypothetical protein
MAWSITTSGPVKTTKRKSQMVIELALPQNLWVKKVNQGFPRHCRAKRISCFVSQASRANGFVKNKIAQRNEGRLC